MCVDKNKNEKKKTTGENPERGIQAKTQTV